MADISVEVLEKYMKLRHSKRMGRVWISTDDATVTLAPIDAPPLFERRYATVYTDDEFIQLVEREWLNRPLDLFK